MDDGTIELIYYCVGNLFISTIASVMSKKSGMVLSCIISAISMLLTILLLNAPGSGGKVLIFGFIFFPGISWFGFWLGGIVRKRFSDPAAR